MNVVGGDGVEVDLQSIPTRNSRRRELQDERILFGSEMDLQYIVQDKSCGGEIFLFETNRGQTEGVFVFQAQ
jgi:hypothetical protein